MRHEGHRAIAALLGRVVVTLVFLLDPDSLLLAVRSTRGGAPVSPVLVVVLLGLVGGAIYLWTRHEPPE